MPNAVQSAILQELAAMQLSEEEQMALASGSPEARALVKMTRGIADPSTGLAAQSRAQMANNQAALDAFATEGGMSPSGKIYRTPTGESLPPELEAMLAGRGQNVSGAGPMDGGADRSVAGNKWAALAAAGQGMSPGQGGGSSSDGPNPEADAFRAKILADNERRLAEKAGQAPVDKPFSVRDEGGIHKFETQAELDRYTARRDAAEIEKKGVQNHNRALAMMGGVNRKVRTGQLTPLDAIKVNSNIAATAGNLDPRVDKDGFATAEFAAQNPQAAAILNENAKVRMESKLGTDALGNQRHGIDVGAAVANKQTDAGLEAAKGDQQTKRVIAKGDQKVALKSQATQKKIAQYVADTGVKQTEIEAEAKRFGHTLDHTVDMRTLDINDKMTDAQIKNLSDVTGLQRTELENNHEARMKGLTLTQKEIKRKYDNEIALGTGEIEARNKATEVAREQYGAEFADRAAERTFQKEQFAHSQYLDKEKATILKENTIAEQAAIKAQNELQAKQLKIEAQNSKVEREARLLEATANAGALDDQGKARLMEVKNQKIQLQADSDRLKNEMELTQQNIERAKVENDELKRQALANKADQALFPKSQYPDVSDRLNARTNWMQTNRAEVAGAMKGGYVPPAVSSYLDDLYVDGKKLYSSYNPFSMDSTHFKNYATESLAATLGLPDDEVRQTVEKYAAAKVGWDW